MSNLSLEQFLHDFRQEVLADAEANMDFLEVEFATNIANELVDAGNIEDFEACHYRAPRGGIRVDGYAVNDNSLDLFIVDFANREDIESLTQTEVSAIFKRVENFFTRSAEKHLYESLEETSQGYGLARLIVDIHDQIFRVNFFLLSERVLSERVTELEEKQHSRWTFTYNIWDISRLHRMRSSQGSREALEIDFCELTGQGLPCLPAHVKSASYKSYLVVMPATVLADLYEKHGSRLLEQNVRSFLQFRGKINKGIRTTIINDPDMFFAYNNGITATARDVITEYTDEGMVIAALKDLQIVNGGQTTASLMGTRQKDKASLDNIFVQMKLSVVDEEKSEEIVPKISEYANTQNKVSAADFFSNHPYHIRMEEFSRRIWAPAQKGAQRETKWFYERARGQYADQQGKMTPANKKRFLVEYPKPQKFTKTDLGKYENAWDEKPRFVNLGAQKNFAKYAERIGKEWEKHPDQFNEFYYKRAIARAIIFKRTEKLVSAQAWYNGGYRANIVAYTIAVLSALSSTKKRSFDFMRVWNEQDISKATERAIEIASKIVFEEIMNPAPGISNIGEWCKKETCWIQIEKRLDEISEQMPAQFFKELVSEEDVQDTKKEAVKTQKIYNGIEAQKAVLEIPAETWAHILDKGKKMNLYSPKEIGVLQVATQMPNKVPTEKQSYVLLEILGKAKIEAIYYE